MTRPRLVIHVIVAALMLFAPIARAAPGPEKSTGKCAEDHPGNGNGNGNGNGPKCSSEDEPSSSETPAPEPSPKSHGESEEGAGSSNGHPHGGPPGHSKDRSGSAQPDPHTTPTPPGDETGDVTLDVSVDRNLAQVGDSLTYTITVHNPGAAPASPTIANTLAEEVRFVSATGAPTSTAGSLTWTLTSLQPGATTTLTWRGRIVTAGDLDATNVVTLLQEGARVETHTYLAQVKGIVLNRAPGEPDWGTHQERRVVFSNRERDASGAPDATLPSSGVLPYTGAPIVTLAAAAVLLFLAGCMLAGDRRRRLSAIVLMVVLVATACTSESPTDGTDAGDRGTAAEEEDEVLGTRVGQDGSDDDESEDVTDPAAQDGAEQDQDEDAQEPADDGAGDDAATQDDDAPAAPAPDAGAAPAPPDDTGDERVREVVLVEVPNEPPAPRALRATPGNNEISLDWDAASRSIVAASSTAIFRADSPVEFLTSLDDRGGAVSTRLTLTNISADERLLVNGRLVLNVTGAAGSIQLSSPSLQQVLDPDDEVAADFEFALPSGSYYIDAAYVPG